MSVHTALERSAHLRTVAPEITAEQQLACAVVSTALQDLRRGSAAAHGWFAHPRDGLEFWAGDVLGLNVELIQERALGQQVKPVSQ